MKLNYNSIQKHIKLIDKNFYFDVELSSLCNIKCSFCPRESIKRQNDMMPPEIWQKLSTWLPVKCNVMFAGMGEPTLHGAFSEIVNEVRLEGRITGITSNGQLAPARVKSLLESEIDFYQISLNSTNSNHYNALSGGYSHDAVINTIDQISRGKPEDKTLQLSFVSNNNYEEENKNREFAQKAGAVYFQKKLHNRGGYLKSCFGVENTFYTCYLFAQVTFISCDGNVLACCHDIESKFILGNILTHSFNEIMEIKKEIIAGNKWFEICSYCNDTGRNSII